MKKFFYSLAAYTALSSSAFAHGVAGDRFFPATLAIDDPAVADELTLPQVSAFKEAGEDDAHWKSEAQFEASKRITENWGISIEGAHEDSRHARGYDNVGLSTKYQFYRNDPHELLLSAGLDWDIGGSGSKQVGERFSTYTPTLFFGKGMGDLPDNMPYLKPLAVTGSLGLALADQAHKDALDDSGNVNRENHPDNFEWGFTLQYNLPYLEEHVKNIGLPQPLNRVIPIVEFAFENELNRGGSRKTTGTINPGFIWSGESTQFGVEAILPLNSESGSNVGVMAQMHFYLDDIFPNTIGKPLF